MHAYDSLMLSHIATVSCDDATSAAASASLEGDAGLQLDGGTFQPILNLFPAVFTHDRTSGSALDSYTLHARIVMNQVERKEQLLFSQQFCFVKVSALHASLGIPYDAEQHWSRFDSKKGPFLEAVFAKLRRFCLLSIKEVLLVTSLVSRILKYPSRAL